MIFLSGLTADEINQKFNFSQKFRGEQIFKNIHSGIIDFEKMTNLSKELRENLKENSQIVSSKIKTEQSSSDGTKKIAINLFDNNIVESVLLITDKDRQTACISTQVGCAMDCQFCLTGKSGLIRNLETHEIVEQFIHLQSNYGKIDNIVFMGMGEPLNNFDNLIKAINIFCDKNGYNFGKRKITISTCGVIPGIKKIIENKIDVKLAVSLNSAIPKKRDEIMPVNNRYPLTELKKIIQEYSAITKKRVTLEYVLIKDFNNSIEDIKAIKNFVQHLNYMVNIIPYNSVDNFSYKQLNERELKFFFEKCKFFGINATIRRSKGGDISGACGQLSNLLKNPI